MTTEAGGFDFGAEVERERIGAGMTLTGLAAAAGVSAAYLHDLIRGKRGNRPSDYMVEAIARGLGVEPDHFRVYRVRKVLALYPEAVDRAYDELVRHA